MNVIVTRNCPCCRNLGRIVLSNNALVPGVCESCLSNLVDYRDLKAVDYFCRTYNIPFDPDKWIAIADELHEEAFATYVSVVMEEYRGADYKMASDHSLLWDKVNKMWDDNITHAELLQSITSLKDEWLKQMEVKWGNQYEFTEYLKLENLFGNTVRSTGTTNPLTIDIIKKIAVISVLMDRALDKGEIKEAGDYSKMHQQLIKSAGLEDMIDINETDAINTIADLCNYLEQNDFQFKFYDGVSRDIVDKTIQDIQEWTINFVRDSTGINQTYQLIEDSYRTRLEQEKTNAVTSATSIEDIIEAKKRGINEELDSTLDQEEFELEDADEDKY